MLDSHFCCVYAAHFMSKLWVPWVMGRTVWGQLMKKINKINQRLLISVICNLQKHCMQWSSFILLFSILCHSLCLSNAHFFDGKKKERERVYILYERLLVLLLFTNTVTHYMPHTHSGTHAPTQLSMCPENPNSV